MLKNNNGMKTLGNSLYWRLSALFLVLLLIVGFAYVFITVRKADHYFMEKQQRLNAGIAESMVHEVVPFLNGEVNKASMDKIMHSMMTINPAVEVYILSPRGAILSYVAPYKKVKLERVNVEPIQAFLDAEGEVYVLGDDPRNPGIQKVFSAARVEEGEKLVGYLYIVLASEEYDTVSRRLRSDYLMSLGGANMLITLVGALVIGLILLWILTRYLRTIIQTVRKFADGDMHARIPIRSGGDLPQLAQTFNSMADTMWEDQQRREEIEQLRRELIANVSHDLRTPLAVIRGYVETLIMKEGQIDEKTRQNYTSTIFNSIKKLERLVNELFELSRLEARQVKPDFEPFPISDLVQDVVQKYQLIAQEKGVQLAPQFESGSPIVNADISMIERVFQNLIDNALKFTPSGGAITIETEVEQGKAEIIVRDTGTGIPEEDIPYIFDRYYKVRNSTTKGSAPNKNGTGLGLAIVKKILEIHDSGIQLESALGKGTAFSFQLPLYTK